jgi:hypothetical protein
MSDAVNTGAQSHKGPFPHKIDAPDALENLQQVSAYQAANSNVFASLPSLNWFIRQHKAELIECGAIVQLTGRWLLDGPVFTKKVIEIGRKTAVARHS